MTRRSRAGHHRGHFCNSARSIKIKAHENHDDTNNQNKIEHFLVEIAAAAAAAVVAPVPSSHK